MALPITQRFSQLVLEITDGLGGFVPIAGLVDVTITRTANVDTSEVPDKDDESLPLSLEKEVRSIEVSVSGTGVWAQESHGQLMDWFYSSSPTQIQIRNANAAVGDTELETGLAILSTLTNERTKGQKVSAQVDIQFDGVPARTAKAP